MKSLFSGFILSSIVSIQAYAFPLPSYIPPAESVMRWEASAYNFEGIVALSNCSGSLIQLEGASDSDRGLILTNGHCYEGGFTAPGAFVYGRPSTRAFTMLNAQAGSLGKVTATEVVYSTMTGTDMTIYKLSETYAQIFAKFKIHPLVLSSTHPQVGEPMEILSGYWRRGYACQTEAFIPQLREDQWTFADSIRYSRPGCETIGGTSGSPILKAGTNIVIGVNNTGNEDGQRCTMNNPCEIDLHGNITFTKGVSYGQQTYWVYTCLNSSREIDLSVAGCLLPH